MLSPVCGASHPGLPWVAVLVGLRIINAGQVSAVFS